MSKQDDESLWFNNLTRDETELFLRDQPKGSFIIRTAESKPGFLLRINITCRPSISQLPTDYGHAYEAVESNLKTLKRLIKIMFTVCQSNQDKI